MSFSEIICLRYREKVNIDTFEIYVIYLSKTGGQTLGVHFHFDKKFKDDTYQNCNVGKASSLLHCTKNEVFF